jgi:hypothetical protein
MTTHRLPDRLHLGLALGLLLALALPGLRGDLYGDEFGHTLRYLRADGPGVVLSDPALVHPPLFFLLARAAYAVVGESWAMRLPSLLFAAATVPLFSLVARRVAGGAAAVPALYLAASSPFLQEFAVEGRTYAMVIFFSVATLLAFLRFLERESPGRAAQLALAAAGGGLTHFSFLLLALFLGLWYLGARRRVTLAAAGAAAGFLLLVGPFLHVQAGSGVQGIGDMLQASWSGGALRPANLLGRLVVALLYGYNLFLLEGLDPARNVGLGALLANPAASLGAALVVAGAGVALVQRVRARGAALPFLLAGAAVPVAVALAGAAAGWYLVREKHLAVIWVFAQLLLLEAGLWLWARRWGRAIVGCHVLLVGFALFNGVWRADTHARRMNWTGLARELRLAAGPGDVAVSYLYPSARQTEVPMPVGAGRQVPEEVLGADGAARGSLAAAADALDRSTPGSVFVVYQETMRNLLDPGDVFLRELGARRARTTLHFGRNLKLFVFAPGAGAREGGR